MGYKRNQRRKAVQPPATVVPGAKIERKTVKTENKISKTEAKTQLVAAKASRLKWLVILIGIGLVAYMVISRGGLGGLGGLLKLFKGGQ